MKMKKLLAALLAVCMLLTMLPVAAFAEDTITVYFRNKHRITFNGQEVVIYHYYSDGSGMVSADDIDVEIYYDGADYYFDMEPVDSDKEFWVAEIPVKYVGEDISFYDPNAGRDTAYFTVPNESGLICDLNSEYYDHDEVEVRNQCWVKFDDSIKSLGPVTGFPDHPEHHVIVSTTEEWDGQEYTYYHCQHCFHVVSSYFGEIILEEDEKYLLKDIVDENLMIQVMPGAEIVAGSDFTVGLVINEGTISGGNITLEEPEYVAYSIDFAPGSFFNFGTISDKTNIDCIAFQNGDEMNFGPQPLMSADAMESSAVINGANVTAEEFYNYGTISNSVIDCDYFQNGYTYDQGDVCVADVFDDVSNDVCIIKNSTLNSSMIVNEAYAIFDHVDCDNQAVHAQLYDEILGEPEVDEYWGTLTWDTVVADKLDMLGYIRNGYSYGEYVGVMDCAAEWTCTEKDALDKYTWKWPSADWFAEMSQPQPKSMMVYDEDSYPVEMNYYGFTVPSGYKLSIEENDFVLHKEEPKPPVIEEEIEKETYDIVVRVKFDGVDEDEIDFVNAQLLKNGKAYKKAVKVDAKDGWRHEWTDLDDSSKIEWSVTADEIEGYDMEIVNVRANYWTITLSAKDAAVEKANPETGADSFVGAAVALAVCSAVCGAALSLKK